MIERFRKMKPGEGQVVNLTEGQELPSSPKESGPHRCGPPSPHPACRGSLFQTWGARGRCCRPTWPVVLTLLSLGEPRGVWEAKQTAASTEACSQEGQNVPEGRHQMPGSSVAESQPSAVSRPEGGRRGRQEEAVGQPG